MAQEHAEATELGPEYRWTVNRHGSPSPGNLWIDLCDLLCYFVRRTVLVFTLACVLRTR